MCQAKTAHFSGPIHCRPPGETAITTIATMSTTGIRQQNNRDVRLQLLLKSAIVWCVLGQSHTVIGISSNGHIAPLVSNSPLSSIQSDPNFLRFGRSGTMDDPTIVHQIPTRTSSNFLRFGKSSAPASEPNFLRFGRQKNGVDPTFLRFGRANNNFLRFGRAADPEFVADDDAPFLREYRQANPNFLRFG